MAISSLVLRYVVRTLTSPEASASAKPADTVMTSIVTLSPTGRIPRKNSGGGASPSTLSTRIFIGHGVSRPAPTYSSVASTDATARPVYGRRYEDAFRKWPKPRKFILGDFLDPKTAARIFHEQRQIPFRDCSVVCRDVGIEEHHSEGRVELQERLEEVVLVPSSAAKDPLLGVFEGPENVVKVDDDAFLQPG